MNLGHTIKRLRKQKGLRQNAFAELCHFSPAYLSQIESNQKDPHLSILKDISTQLSIPLPILFFLALDETDIPERKQEAFKLIQPLVHNLINDFFIAVENH
jgi:XRE family transcriptional regulator, regulator of sulfur utilization